MLFQSAFFENEISDCSASVMFIGHLINHGVVSFKFIYFLILNSVQFLIGLLLG